MLFIPAGIHYLVLFNCGFHCILFSFSLIYVSGSVFPFFCHMFWWSFAFTGVLSDILFPLMAIFLIFALIQRHLMELVVFFSSYFCYGIVSFPVILSGVLSPLLLSVMAFSFL